MLLLLLSHFSRVQLCMTPYTAAHQVPPSLGLPRQEHWSELPVPSPMHESEKWKVKVNSLSWVRLFMTPWTAAYQASPSMGFSRQEYWSGVPLPSPWGIQKSHELLKKIILAEIDIDGHSVLPSPLYFINIKFINFIKFINIKCIKFKLSIYFWLRRVLIAVCRLAPVAASGGYSPVVVVGLLTLVTPLVAEHVL